MIFQTEPVISINDHQWFIDRWIKATLTDKVDRAPHFRIGLSNEKIFRFGVPEDDAVIVMNDSWTYSKMVISWIISWVVVLQFDTHFFVGLAMWPYWVPPLAPLRQTSLFNILLHQLESHLFAGLCINYKVNGAKWFYRNDETTWVLKKQYNRFGLTCCR